MNADRFIAADDLPPVIDGTSTPASAREREVAVLDATCQVSSGWVNASYDAEWNQQVAQIRAHADELERARAQASAQRERALQVIAEHAPTP